MSATTESLYSASPAQHLVCEKLSEPDISREKSFSYSSILQNLLEKFVRDTRNATGHVTKGREKTRKA